MQVMKVDETATASSDQDSQAIQLDESTSLASSSDEDGRRRFYPSLPPLDTKAMKVDDISTASSDQDSQAAQLDENASLVSGWTMTDGDDSTSPLPLLYRR